MRMTVNLTKAELIQLVKDSLAEKGMILVQEDLRYDITTEPNEHHVTALWYMPDRMKDFELIKRKPRSESEFPPLTGGGFL